MSMSSAGESSTPPKATRTCDNCRKRKIKCVEEGSVASGKPCEGCRKLGLECTYDYVKKKPGRKNTFAASMKSQQNGHPQQNSQQSLQQQNNIQHNQISQQQQNTVLRSPTQPLGGRSNSYTSQNHGQHFHPYAFPPAPSVSDPIPLRQPLQMLGGPTLAGPSSEYDPILPSPAGYATPKGYSSFAYDPSGIKSNENGLGWLDQILDTSGTWGMGTSSSSNANNNNDPAFLDNGVGGFGNTIFPSDQAQLLSLESPEHSLPPGSASGGAGSLANLLHPSRREPQLEDVTSWADISHFISLFLQYLYPLLPLVHRPTFAENLATRRDLRDTDFRALLLSIVAYVISQLPTSRLVNDRYDIEGLKRLQRRCHRTGKMLQRTYYGPTNLTQICTIIFDTFYLLSIGLGHTAAARLGQAIQLAFSMGMHSDSKTLALGLDDIEIQLRRRVFWQLYASDKTRAIPGPPMLINDFQGICSLPEPTDDDFITSQGTFPQPPTRTSFLAGFVSLSRIFKILSECFFHHRCLLSDVRTIGMDWTTDAENRLHAVLREMPSAIQEPLLNPHEPSRQVFAMQRANILITAAIAKFALYDLRASLNVDDEAISRDRENIAREIHSLLMNIPVEDLASNGESVRAKVFHIACALCAQTSPNDADQELIRDWCNMFSAISFVQMPPPQPGADVLDSRANSPPAQANESGSIPGSVPSHPTGAST